MFRPLLFALILLGPAKGHTDISDTIKDLTAQLAEKPTAALYYQRATEYRALREKTHAIEDLRSALQLDPKFRPAKIALIRELGKSDEALTLATASNNGTTEAIYLVAKIHHLRSEHQQALAFCEKIQKLSKNHEPEIDLLHAQILLDLSRPTEAAQILKAAWKRTKSIVLRNNWIDTALTAGQTGEVLPIIEKELATSRFLSSWLIRRARAALILQEPKQASKDLKAALTELSPRIRPDQPDLTLIADRGLIHALLGNEKEARKDLETLKNSPLPATTYRLLTQTLD